MWPPGHPIHSDIDLLVVTRDELSEVEIEELTNETYELTRDRGFLERVASDTQILWDATAPRTRDAGG